jgi:CubicO group peptidase (beta-lactamase class C family)
MRKKIEARAREAIEEHVFPGCVVGIVHKSGPSTSLRTSEREIVPCGNLTYEKDSAPVREDTIYDVASITKSIPTASLALMLMAEGKLALADKVSLHLPELKNDHGATIKDLLSYTVHGPKMSELKEKSAEGMRKYIFEHGFDAASGTSEYTNLPAFLLGIIVERTGGDTLDALAQQHFFNPLGMRNTTFFPNTGRYNLPVLVAPTEVVDGEEVRGIVHDESARVFARAGKATGHAGLFSTAPDILTFLENLLRETYPYIVEGAQRGWGWQANDARFMGKHARPHTFGKTGFTGTSCVVDIERGVAFVILSNRTYPKRPPDDCAINAFRSGIADAIFENIAQQRAVLK